jgi:hypothetical protein
LQPFDLFDDDRDGGDDFQRTFDFLQTGHGDFSAGAVAWPLASVPA